MFLPPVLRPVAYAFAKLYELGVRTRLQWYERGWLKTRKLPAPVISVGNLTVGGTGKTPCTAYLANLLTAEGYRVAILSRGYQRTSQGIVEVSDGERILCSPWEAGDEPYLLAQQCSGVRVVVNADRYEAGMWLWRRAKVDVFLLDDGYQHIGLHRDVNLALIDAQEDLAQARLLPHGRWREPVEQLLRASAVMITRVESPADGERLTAQLRRYTTAPIFHARHALTGLRRLPTYETQDLTVYRNQPVAAFTGIAQPDKFFADLQSVGLSVVWRRAFADHHRYQLNEVNDLCVAARAAGAHVILTTEKDAANLPPDFFGETPRVPLYATQMRFDCYQAEALRELIFAAVRGSR
ncbi:MAG: tetraacyldisaccharide 4'-kinase [Acidobacteria bacterium]|nr:tetraacyldisaccharide 4'-kinase [Acidobacteriota bacterium]